MPDESAAYWQGRYEGLLDAVTLILGIEPAQAVEIGSEGHTEADPLYGEALTGGEAGDTIEVLVDKGRSPFIGGTGA